MAEEDKVVSREFLDFALSSQPTYLVHELLDIFASHVFRSFPESGWV